MPANRSIQILDETIQPSEIQRIVIDDPNERLSITIRLSNETVLRISGEEAGRAIHMLCSPEFGLI